MRPEAGQQARPERLRDERDRRLRPGNTITATTSGRMRRARPKTVTGSPGIYLQDATATVIGGPDASERNVIAGNGGDGIVSWAPTAPRTTSRATTSAWGGRLTELGNLGAACGLTPPRTQSGPRTSSSTTAQCDRRRARRGHPEQDHPERYSRQPRPGHRPGGTTASRRTTSRRRPTRTPAQRPAELPRYPVRLDRRQRHDHLGDDVVRPAASSTRSSSSRPRIATGSATARARRSSARPR